MDKPDDGGPAFPMPEQLMLRHYDGAGEVTGSTETFAEDEQASWPGMTLRDYFAAHAQAEIPGWFKHDPPPHDYPELPEPNDFFPVAATVPAEYGASTSRELARAWMRDSCFDLPKGEEWDRFAKAVIWHREARAAWERADRMARLVQWRWVYADAMIAARQPTGGGDRGGAAG